MSENPLQPLADTLLAARRLDGIWPEPLDWLAGQVFDGVPVPHDPVALHWPAGWATGLGRKWMEQHLSAFRPRALRYQKWYDVLGDTLSDSVYVEEERHAIAALVEAVKAIAEGTHE